jgi:hypothetical protein
VPFTQVLLKYIIHEFTSSTSLLIFQVEKFKLRLDLTLDCDDSFYDSCIIGITTSPAQFSIFFGGTRV